MSVEDRIDGKGEIQSSPAPALKVWWIPQVPMKRFQVDVPDLRTAHILLDALASYDLFQLKHNIKPDYSNAGGLMVRIDGGWEDWCDEETGEDFDEYRARVFASRPEAKP